MRIVASAFYKNLDSPIGEAFIELGDIFLSILFIGPLSIINWKATWSLMDIYVYPGDPVISATITAAFGILMGLVLYIFQNQFSDKLTPEMGRVKFFVFTRAYTYFAGISNVAACRGVWNLLDCLKQSPMSILYTTVISTIALISIKALRNVISAPFCIIVDDAKGYFEAPTFYRKVCDRYFL